MTAPVIGAAVAAAVALLAVMLYLYDPSRSTTTTIHMNVPMPPSAPPRARPNANHSNHHDGRAPSTSLLHPPPPQPPPGPSPAQRAAIAAGRDFVRAAALLGAPGSTAGDAQTAEALLAHSIATDPTNAEAHLLQYSALRRGQRACADDAERARYARASVATLRRAVALAPRLAAAHSDLGVALAHARRVDEARAAFDAGLAAVPRDEAASLRDNAAVAHLKAQRRELAVLLLHEALAARQQNTPHFPFHILPLRSLVRMIEMCSRLTIYLDT